MSDQGQPPYYHSLSVPMYLSHIITVSQRGSYLAVRRLLSIGSCSKEAKRGIRYYYIHRLLDFCFFFFLNFNVTLLLHRQEALLYQHTHDPDPPSPFSGTRLIYLDMISKMTGNFTNTLLFFQPSFLPFNVVLSRYRPHSCPTPHLLLFIHTCCRCCCCSSFFS